MDEGNMPDVSQAKMSRSKLSRSKVSQVKIFTPKNLKAKWNLSQSEALSKHKSYVPKKTL